MPSKVRHTVTNEQAPLELHDGRLHVITPNGPVLFKPETGEWNYDEVGAPLDPVQRAQLLYGADVVMREILGERVYDSNWRALRPEEMALWIQDGVKLIGVRKRLRDHLLLFLGTLELDREL